MTRTLPGSTFGRRLTGLIAGTLALIVLSACQPVNPFPEYVGVNILENRGITAATAGPGYLDGTLPGNGFPYIELTTLTPAEYGTAAGLPAGAEVYRLEILNLLPDGDFEASTVTQIPGGGVTWDEPVGPAVEFEIDDEVIDGVPGFGTGQYLRFDVSTAGFGAINLADYALDELVPNGVYHIQFDVVRKTPTTVITLDYGENLTSYLDENQLSWTFGTPAEELPDTPVQRFPDPANDVFRGPGTFYASASGTGSLHIGSPKAVFQASAGFIDNIRIGRIDVFPHWAFVLPTQELGTLEIVPGRYRFRVFVKSEIDSQITPEPAGWNRFRSGQITIGANNSFQTYRRSDHGWGIGTWVELTYEFNVSAGDLMQNPGLTIQLSPSSLDTPAVGSILIASPVLELVY